MELVRMVCIFHNLNKIAKLEIALFIPFLLSRMFCILNEYQTFCVNGTEIYNRKKHSYPILNIFKVAAMRLIEKSHLQIFKTNLFFQTTFSFNTWYCSFFFWGCKLCYRSNSNKTNTRYEDTSSLFLPNNRMESIADASL